MHEVATLPGKLSVWAQALSPEIVGKMTENQVQALVTSLQALSYRMQDLLEADALRQSKKLVRELMTDVRRWRVGVQEIFGRLTDKPEKAEVGELRYRLDAVLGRLEGRIEELMDNLQDGGISEEESENMYRLLGAHRGVSEALVDFSRQAVGIDWVRLREERF